MAKAESAFFQFVFGSLDNALSDFVTQSVTNLCAGIALPMQTALTLYIVVYGYQVMTGRVDQPLQDFISKIVKITLILNIALFGGLYNNWVIDFFAALRNGIVEAIAFDPAGDGAAKTTASVSIYTLLDAKFNEGLDLILKIWKEAGIPNLGNFLIAAGLAVAFLVLFTAAAIVITLSNVGIAILMGIGPLFICLLLFPATAKFFDKWLEQVVNYTLVMIFGVIVVTLSVSTIGTYIEYAKSIDSNAIFDTVNILAMGLIFATILKQVPSIASSLSGGIAMQFNAFAVGAAAGIGALAGAKLAGAGAKKAHNAMKKETTHTDKKSGKTTTASRYGHLFNKRVGGVFKRANPPPLDQAIQKYLRSR